MSLDVGELVEGKYRIMGLIGEGGMGAVYLGENVRIQRKVAIKVLHGSFSGNSEVVARFEREAQAAGRIGNDHILEVLDLGALANGDHFMVMEYLDGETLSARIKRFGRLMPRQILPIAQQMLAGLAAAALQKAPAMRRSRYGRKAFCLPRAASINTPAFAL